MWGGFGFPQARITAFHGILQLQLSSGPSLLGTENEVPTI